MSCHCSPLHFLCPASNDDVQNRATRGVVYLRWGGKRHLGRPTVSQSFSFSMALTAWCLPHSMSTCLKDKVIGHWLHIIIIGDQPFTNLSWQSSSSVPALGLFCLTAVQSKPRWKQGCMGGCCIRTPLLCLPKYKFCPRSSSSRSVGLWLADCLSVCLWRWMSIDLIIMKNREPTKIWLSITISFWPNVPFFELINNKQVLCLFPCPRSHLSAQLDLLGIFAVDEYSIPLLGFRTIRKLFAFDGPFQNGNKVMGQVDQQ